MSFLGTDWSCGSVRSISAEPEPCSLEGQSASVADVTDVTLLCVLCSVPHKSSHFQVCPVGAGSPALCGRPACPSSPLSLTPAGRTHPGADLHRLVHGGGLLPASEALSASPLQPRPADPMLLLPLLSSASCSLARQAGPESPSPHHSWESLEAGRWRDLRARLTCFSSLVDHRLLLPDT